MDETKVGRIAKGDDRCLAQAVENCVCNGQGLVDRVGCIPIALLVIASTPLDAGTFRGLAIDRPLSYGSLPDRGAAAG